MSAENNEIEEFISRQEKHQAQMLKLLADNEAETVKLLQCAKQHILQGKTEAALSVLDSLIALNSK